MTAGMRIPAGIRLDRGPECQYRETSADVADISVIKLERRTRDVSQNQVRVDWSK
jgi:hypothetical protein